MARVLFINVTPPEAILIVGRDAFLMDIYPKLALAVIQWIRWYMGTDDGLTLPPDTDSLAGLCARAYAQWPFMYCADDRQTMDVLEADVD